MWVMDHKLNTEDIRQTEFSHNLLGHIDKHKQYKENPASYWRGRVQCTIKHAYKWNNTGDNEELERVQVDTYIPCERHCLGRWVNYENNLAVYLLNSFRKSHLKPQNKVSIR